MELLVEGNDIATGQYHGESRHDASLGGILGTSGSINGQVGESSCRQGQSNVREMKSTFS